jgi:hypothetical protein
MQPTKSDDTGLALRRAWHTPTLTVVSIGSETKSSHAGNQTTAAQSSMQGEPPSPAAPASKLGFSLEWAFPLASRWEE